MATQAPTQPQEQTQALATQPIVKIREMLTKSESQIMLAMPKTIGVDAKKMNRVALTLIQEDPTGKLLKCDPVTIVAAVVQAAQVGLVPDGFLGQSYLVPFWDKDLYGKGKGGYAAKLMIGYRGFIELATRTGKVTHVAASVVHESDFFEYEEGVRPVLKHRPAPPSKRGAPIGAYAIAFLKEPPSDGQHPFRFLWTEEIEMVRLKSQSGHDDEGNPKGIWKDHWPEMAKKTAVRAMSKYLNLSPELVTAAVIDEYNEAGVRGVTIDGETGRVIVPTESDSSRAEGSYQSTAAGIKAKIAEAKNGKTVDGGTAKVVEESMNGTQPAAPPAAPVTQPSPAAAVPQASGDAEYDSGAVAYKVKQPGGLVHIAGKVKKVWPAKPVGDGLKTDIDIGDLKVSSFHHSPEAKAMYLKMPGQFCTLICKPKEGKGQYEGKTFYNLEGVFVIGETTYDSAGNAEPEIQARGDVAEAPANDPSDPGPGSDVWGK